MAIAGLATYQSFSMNYSVRRDSKDSDSGDGGNFMNQMLTFHKKDTATVQDKDGKDVSADKEAASELRFGGIQGMSPVGKYGELKPYTRCITANIKTKEMIAHDNNGQMVYSYQEEEKSFSIFINSDGKDKTYTIKGVDENGQEIEEEFNPYDLDPEMMDFPEFSALCMYIRQTDETADLMTKMAFTDTSYFDGIFEKGDRVPMLKDYAQEYQDVAPSLAKLASQLFNAINDFFDKAALNRGLSEDGINMLFEDKEADSIGKSDEPIRESVITRHTEYKDPETDKKVPVDIRYTTSYSDSGISCTERSDVGGKVSERSLWTLEYDNPESYSKVQDFLKSFSEDQKLTFATQEKFWNDFMQEDFDIQGFRAFYETTDNGRIDVEKALAEGKSMRETLTEPNAEYFNNQSFIGHVWTEQEMWDNWYARIDASQRAARANGSGIEPPTETIVTTNKKGAQSAKGVSSIDELKQVSDVKSIWNWYDGNLGFYADVYKTGDNDSEYRVKLRYNDGREEERIVDIDKINASNCNIVDLHLKMYHLRDEGKIDQEGMMMDLTMAHFYMEKRIPGANENTNINFKSWYTQQLELEMNNDRNEKNISRLMNLLKYL